MRVLANRVGSCELLTGNSIKSEFHGQSRSELSYVILIGDSLSQIRDNGNHS
jgi:hypothetical protein